MHMRLRTAAAAVLVSLLAAAAGVVGFAGPAQAAVTYFYGTAKQTYSGSSVDGISGNLAMANPFVDSAAGDFHSLAEFAVSDAARNNSVEAGWIKDPTVYGSSPVLFVFNKRNGAAGCYNGCGWVDYGPNTLNAGAAVPAADLGTSKQFIVQHSGGAWWVAYNGSWLGYYPDSYWTAVGVTFTSVTDVRGYGEVAVNSASPCTDMGDGLLPSSGSAAYVSSLQKHDAVSGVWSAGAWGTPQVLPSGTSTAWYNVAVVSATKFTYGGPGAC
jgi:neprosin-like protein